MCVSPQACLPLLPSPSCSPVHIQVDDLGHVLDVCCAVRLSTALLSHLLTPLLSRLLSHLLHEPAADVQQGGKRGPGGLPLQERMHVPHGAAHGCGRGSGLVETCWGWLRSSKLFLQDSHALPPEGGE